MPQLKKLFPRQLIETLNSIESTSSVLAAIAPEQRKEALEWLNFVLRDFEALKEHIDFLSQLRDEPFQVPTPRRDSWSVNPSEQPHTGRTSRHNLRFSDELVACVMNEGVECLNAEQLADLLLNPHALYDLFDVIDETLPDAWLDPLPTAFAQASQPQLNSPNLSSDKHDFIVDSKAQAASYHLKWPFSPLGTAVVLLITIIPCYLITNYITSLNHKITKLSSERDAALKMSQAKIEASNGLIPTGTRGAHAVDLITIVEQHYQPEVSPGENLQILQEMGGNEMKGKILAIKQKFPSAAEDVILNKLLTELGFMPRKVKKD